MNDIITVSIICDVYNHAPYLRQCLDGFIMQKTSFAYEVLIHDDASTDDSADIIREYEEKYPNIIKPIYQNINQYSQGISIWHNFQIPRAKGRYIAFCEGDDYWIDSLKLQKQVDYLELNSTVGFVFTNYKYQKGDDLLKKTDKHINFTTLGLYYQNPVRTLTVLLKKHLLLECYEFYLKNRWHKVFDFPIFLWFSLNSEISYINDFTGVYRIHDTSMTHDKELKNKLEFYTQLYSFRLFANKLFELNVSEESLLISHLLYQYKNCLIYDNGKEYLEHASILLFEYRNNVCWYIRLLLKYEILENLIHRLLLIIRGIYVKIQ